MKKHLLIGLIFICIGQLLPAQYQPLPDSGAVWSVLTTIMANDQSTSTYSTAGDTLISGNLYTILLANGSPAAAFYQDSTRKVWVNRLYGNPSFLMYDFGLQTGDTVYVREPAFEQALRVDMIDTVVIFDGSSRRRWTLNTMGSPWQDTEYWIDGIGSSRGILQAGEYIWDSYSELLCLEKDGIPVYRGPNFVQYECNYNSVNRETELSGPKVSIYPQPSGPTSLLEVRPQGSGEWEMKVINLMGSVFYQRKGLRGELSTRLSQFDLNPGFYLLQVKEGTTITSTKFWLQ